MLGVDLPPTPPIEINHTCLAAAAYYYQVPPEVLVAVRIQEGGWPGFERTNTNASRDLGVMQINTIHLKLFQRHGVSEAMLRDNECVSLFAGAYILKSELERAPDFWTGVGHYHSRTAGLRDVYVGRIKARLDELMTKHRAYFTWLRGVLIPRLAGR